jgi:hypothetical protein
MPTYTGRSIRNAHKDSSFISAMVKKTCKSASDYYLLCIAGVPSRKELVADLEQDDVAVS